MVAVSALKGFGIAAFQFFLRLLDGSTQIFARHLAQFCIRRAEHGIPGLNAGIPKCPFPPNPDAREMAKCVLNHEDPRHFKLYSALFALG
jgi:hypothetical protein